MMKPRLEIIESKEEKGFFHVYSKKGQFLGSLGNISYYKTWKKWVWEQESDIVMSYDCLQEVVDFIKKKEKKQ